MSTPWCCRYMEGAAEFLKRVRAAVNRRDLGIVFWK